MGELPAIEDAQRVDLTADTWLVVHVPAGGEQQEYEAEFRELATAAHERGALLVALPAGYTIDQLPAVEIERAGWARTEKLTQWRRTFESIAVSLESADTLEQLRAAARESASAARKAVE